jgi:hypothetical protein
VWTWNAIGKAPGAWGLSDDANESQRGFLLNHLISEELPGAGGAPGLSNSDPITGQAAWYDVRVRIRAAMPGDAAQTWPQVKGVPAAPGTTPTSPRWRAYFAGREGRS